jgi:SSS family solute:Na+ symporter
MVYPRLVFDLLPVGLVGLVVAGFLAALMSSIASTFNSASTLVTMDFVRRMRPGMEDKSLVMTGRITTLMFMVLAVLWAPQIENFQSVWSYLQSVLAYACPPVVALFLVGLFWRRANAAGAIAAIVSGVGAGAFLFWAIVITGQYNIHFLYVAPILFVISATALVAGSLLVPNARRGGEELNWTPTFYREETKLLAGLPWWQNYRVLSLLLLALTAALVFWFR